MESFRWCFVGTTLVANRYFQDSAGIAVQMQAGSYSHCLDYVEQ
jgi:hypothetical protein